MRDKLNQLMQANPTATRFWLTVEVRQHPFNEGMFGELSASGSGGDWVESSLPFRTNQLDDVENHANHLRNDECNTVRIVLKWTVPDESTTKSVVLHYVN